MFSEADSLKFQNLSIAKRLLNGDEYKVELFRRIFILFDYYINSKLLYRKGKRSGCSF